MEHAPTIPRGQHPLIAAVRACALAFGASNGADLAADRLFGAIESLIDSEDDAEVLGRISDRIYQLQTRVQSAKVRVETASASVQPHITFSTKFAGAAFKRSKKAKELFEQFGCTGYNPNVDCEQKPGDAVKGQSNWLLSFREQGLERSRRTRGFVVQLQENAERERSDMQVAEEGMATEIEKHGLPIIGIFGDLSESDVAKALDIAHRQWASGQFVESAVPAEDHVLGDNGAAWLSAHFTAMGALPQLRELRLAFNEIGDAGVEALANAAGSGALASVTWLLLSGNKIGDQGMIKFSEALATGPLASVTRLHLDRNQIGDKGLVAFSGALAMGAMAHC